MQQRTSGSAKASEVSGKWSKYRVGSWKDTGWSRERPGKRRSAWEWGATVAALAGGRVSGQSAAAGGLQRVEKGHVGPFRPRRPLPGLWRAWDALRGAECSPQRPGGGRRAACWKTQESPEAVGLRRTSPAASLKWSQQFRGGGEGSGRGMRGRAGNRMQRGV